MVVRSSAFPWRGTPSSARRGTSPPPGGRTSPPTGGRAPSPFPWIVILFVGDAPWNWGFGSLEFHFLNGSAPSFWTRLRLSELLGYLVSGRASPEEWTRGVGRATLKDTLTLNVSRE
ncbi:hypothetical protein PIB30_093412 [Stylosanthes scabra]|uniref:Uncharacterized protein n=1 Tax=Stylosanthes scabra TaxID=79078 RepID=A0ABU6SVQ4_9FABA|nr:hypothetical protein [Stylosanthes scabra]